ncbi:MAG: MBL fold metallo-hydrolase [Candidatus Bathyarchaeia archaeon]
MESVNNLRLKKGEVGILWFGQNTYVLKTSRGTTIAIDPYLSRDKRISHVYPEPPIKPEEFKVDYIFCTHDHWDHTDPIALPIIAKKFYETVILGSLESCRHLTELGVEKKNLVTLQHKTNYTLRDFTVTPYYSVPPEEADTTHFGYVFEIDGIKIYNMGDTFQSVVNNPKTILQEIAEVSPDIAMFPIIGDTPQRKPEDAFKFAMIVKPKIVIPCHYDCFSDRTIDPQKFVKLFKEVTDMKPVVIPYKGNYVYSIC